MEFTPGLIVFAFAVHFVCFFIKGVAAFGDPLLSNPLFSMVLDNKVISPMNLLLGAPLNGYMMWKNRKFYSIKKVIPMAVCVLAGVIPGTLLLKYATSWVLKAVLGVLILGIGMEMLLRNRNHGEEKGHNKVMMVIACISSGITAGLYGINLFFVAYVERIAKSREEFRGNVCFIFLTENVFRIIVYIVGGVFTKSILLLFLVSLPGMLLGFMAGSKVDKKLSDETIRRIIITLFMLGGVSVLVKALLFRA